MTRHGTVMLPAQLPDGRYFATGAALDACLWRYPAVGGVRLEGRDSNPSRHPSICRNVWVNVRIRAMARRPCMADLGARPTQIGYATHVRRPRIAAAGWPRWKRPQVATPTEHTPRPDNGIAEPCGPGTTFATSQNPRAEAHQSGPTPGGPPFATCIRTPPVHRRHRIFATRSSRRLLLRTLSMQPAVRPLNSGRCRCGSIIKPAAPLRQRLVAFQHGASAEGTVNTEAACLPGCWVN
jgi:hypothetical protein